jgi:GTPase
MFSDRAKIHVAAGRGGNGCVSFRRETHVPRGGPDGGDGGAGGDVWIVADPQARDLSLFQTRVHFKAGPGRHGEGSNRQGARGRDREIPVPLGTQVWAEEALLADLTKRGQRYRVSLGGSGGQGNARFTTSTRQAPRFAELGEEGESGWVTLTLKLMADVGLAGLPNAGKSMLLRKISNARPKVADYPFTTLQPMLGVVTLPGSEEPFMVADVPGLLEGASSGVGLGTQFLAHLERCHLILHVVDLTGYYGGEPLQNFHTILSELEAHTPELGRKPQLVVLNKIDAVPETEVREWVKVFRAEVELLQRAGHPAFSFTLSEGPLRAAEMVWPISAASGQGVKPLLQGAGRVLAGLAGRPGGEGSPDVSFRRGPALGRADEGAGVDDYSGTHVVFRPKGRAKGPSFTVRREEEGFVVEGEAIRRMVARTDLANDEAVRYLGERLDRMGLNEALVEQGVEPGDEVMVEGFLFEYR